MEKTVRFHRPIERAQTAASAVGTGTVPLVILSAVVFAASAAIARHSAMLDYPVLVFVNTHFVGAPLVDVIAAKATELYTLSGVLFVSMIVYCWFSSGAEMKARVLSGGAAAVLAGLFGRCLQVVYTSHPRPVQDPGLNFHLHWGVDPGAFNRWGAFPSDHAAVWFGLATVILMASPALGRLAVGWACVTTAIRIYLGIHALSDILGGAALGALFVSVSQFATLRQISAGLIGWGERNIAPFYAVLFFVGFQVATLFDDIRELAVGIAKVLHLPHP